MALAKLRHRRGVVEVHVRHDDGLDVLGVEPARAQLRRDVLAGSRFGRREAGDDPAEVRARASTSPTGAGRCRPGTARRRGGGPGTTGTGIVHQLRARGADAEHPERGQARRRSRRTPAEPRTSRLSSGSTATVAPACRPAAGRRAARVSPSPSSLAEGSAGTPVRTMLARRMGERLPDLRARTCSRARSASSPARAPASAARARWSWRGSARP